MGSNKEELAMAFFNALNSASYIQDPRLRDKVMNEIAEMGKFMRGERPKSRSMSEILSENLDVPQTGEARH